MTDLIRAELQALIDSAENHVSPYRSHEDAWDAALDRARAALAAAPPAHVPHEALAARPLLEQVARMGDRIGQHTVGEVSALSDRAAAWLAQNPPGQPVAIEPRGCPIPGACACVEPATAPPADGEVEELAALMEQDAECLEAEQPDLMSLDNHQLRRAAALLREARPQPTPVAPPAAGEAIGPEWRPCVKLPITVHVREQRPGETHVTTRSGITPIRFDDMIMRGPQGEEYPIGRELFNATYRLGSAPADGEADGDRRWTEGVCGDGVVILFDGAPVPVEEVVRALNSYNCVALPVVGEVEGC